MLICTNISESWVSTSCTGNIDDTQFDGCLVILLQPPPGIDVPDNSKLARTLLRYDTVLIDVDPTLITYRTMGSLIGKKVYWDNYKWTIDTISPATSVHLYGIKIFISRPKRASRRHRPQIPKQKTS